MTLDTWRRTTYTWAPGVLWQRTLRGAVVLAPVGGPIELNASGVAVWERLGVPCVVTDVVASVAAEYQVRPEDIADDVAAVVDMLCAHGVVHCVADAP